MRPVTPDHLADASSEVISESIPEAIPEKNPRAIAEQGPTEPDHFNSIVLDVTEMEPPEPMLAIIKALVQLPPEHRLDVYHRRQPVPLYPMLAQTGYCYQCIAIDSHFQIQIWPSEHADSSTLARLSAQAPACT